MSIWRVLSSGVRRLFRRETVERDLEDEVAHYLELGIRERIAAGMSPVEARRTAQAELGSTTTAKFDVRTSGWEFAVETLLQDFRYAIRRLLKTPAFTVVAALSIALGIGANTAIFSLVNATLARDLPVSKPEELAYVTSSSGSGSFSYPDYTEIRDHNRVFDGFVAWAGITASLNAGSQTDLVNGAIVTGNYFNVLGVQPQLGRFLSPDDDRAPLAHPIVVISNGLWHRRFGGRPDIVGQAVRLNGHPFTIVGVAEPTFVGARLGSVIDIYAPMMMQAVLRPPQGGYSGEMNPDLLQTRSRWLLAVGRLRPGTTVAQALADLKAVEAEQQRLQPNTVHAGGAAVTPVNNGPSSAAQRAQIVSVAILMMAVVGTVLLIACANVANLLLARSSGRAKEIAVRLAIGASRGRLVRQLLTESVVLSLLGGALGLILAWVAIGAIRAAPPPPGSLPFALTFALDTRVLLFTFALSVLTGIVFGLAPAIQASRPQLIPALKEGMASSPHRRGRMQIRDALVMAQVSLSLVLLVAAGLFLRSMQRTQAIDPGFQSDRVLTANLNINLLRYTRDQGRAFYRNVVERAEALPGVESATLARAVPLIGGTTTRSLLIEGRDGPTVTVRSDGGLGLATSGTQDLTNSATVGLRYFATMGIALRRGRDFSASDDTTATGVVIVNEAFAHQHFPNVDPLGKRISYHGQSGPWLEIVGLVADNKWGTLQESPLPMTYLPVMQNHETGMTLHVRTRDNPAALVAALRAAIQELEPNLPTPNVRTMQSLLDLSLYTTRAGAGLVAAFGALALLLACMGLYGVMAYSVSRRKRELGLRMALGARAADVHRQIVSEGVKLAAVGVCVGIGAALALSGLLERFLYGIGTMDAMTFAVVPLLLLAVSALACLVPARRATQIDPIKALRQE